MPRRPRIRRPRLSRIPGVKAPDLWSLTAGVVAAYPLREIRKKTKVETIPEPPPDWPGTKPEWIVFFVLLALGYQYGIDFLYRERIPGLLARNFGEIDFLLPALGIAFEVQGRYFHYERGIEQIRSDALKKALVEAQGLTLIALDEEDLIEGDPFWLVSEGLKGRDHSRRVT
jgi:hypothetical protein